MKLKVRFVLLAISLLALFLVVNATPPDQTRTFEGCWTFYASGQCRAIYRDSQNNYFICGNCDSSGNPGSGSCSKISQQTLNQGYWCS